jgi:hypothetical protein
MIIVEFLFGKKEKVHILTLGVVLSAAGVYHKIQDITANVFTEQV